MKIIHCRRGASALEFALVGAIFFIIILASIDAFRYFMVIQGLQNFNADARRYMMVNVSTNRTLCGTDLLNAVGRQGVIGNFVSVGGICASRSEEIPRNRTIPEVTIQLNMDAEFAFIMGVFGINSVRIRENATTVYTE